MTQCTNRNSWSWILVASIFVSAGTQDQEELSESQKQQLAQTVANVFAETHDGWSSDEVILQDELNERFVSRCKEELPELKAQQFNWTLLNLRKAGKLETKTTKTNRQDLSEVLHVGEMAARFVEDKTGLTTDRQMVDPEVRAEFDAAVQAICEGADPYLARKAAFRLRKTRQLKPELITRIADWGRQVSQHSVEKLTNDLELVPEQPGIYIFRDADGYLYIGEAADLRARLSQHLDQSDRQSLANYLREEQGTDILVEIHAFDSESRAKEVMIRRAYESELIRSRKPRFNIRP